MNTQELTAIRPKVEDCKICSWCKRSECRVAEFQPDLALCIECLDVGIDTLKETP